MLSVVPVGVSEADELLSSPRVPVAVALEKERECGQSSIDCQSGTKLIPELLNVMSEENKKSFLFDGESCLFVPTVCLSRSSLIISAVR